MREKIGDHDSVSTLFLAGISAVICVESIRLGPGSFSNPGPGLFPLICGAVLGILSLTSFFLSGRNLIRQIGEFLEAKPKTKVRLIIASMLIYPFFMQLLGFRLVTIIWMLFVCRIVGRIGWKGSIVMSVITSFSCYYLFSNLLNIQFPRGLFGF